VLDQPAAGVDYPRNWHELLGWFPDDAACLRYLEKLRWEHGFVRLRSGRRWLVADARRAAPLHGLPVGNVRHRGHDLRGDAHADGERGRVDLVRRQPEGGRVRARAPAGARVGQLPAGVGVVAQASARDGAAWRELLCGVVEIDETYVGARHTSVGGRSLGHKTIVVIAVEGDQAPERVRMRRIPNVKRDTLTDFVLDHVARGSEVRTDAWTGYDEVGRYRFDHVVTNMSSSGDPAHVALAYVHLVASLLNRWILGTHQGAISHTQLDYYLDEFTFRLNRRRARDRGLLFYRLVEGAIATEPTPTRTSSANPGNSLRIAESGERSGYPAARKGTPGPRSAVSILRARTAGGERLRREEALDVRGLAGERRCGRRPVEP
jgi:ISXO2-like transposase domain